MVLAEAPLTGVATRSDSNWMSRYTPQERVHINRLQQFLGTDPFAYLRNKVALYPESEKQRLYTDQYATAMDLLDKVRNGVIKSPEELDRLLDKHENDEVYSFLGDHYEGLSVAASRILFAFYKPQDLVPGIEYSSQVRGSIKNRS